MITSGAHPFMHSYHLTSPAVHLCTRPPDLFVPTLKNLRLFLVSSFHALLPPYLSCCLSLYSPSRSFRSYSQKTSDFFLCQPEKCCCAILSIPGSICLEITANRLSLYMSPVKSQLETHLFLTVRLVQHGQKMKTYTQGGQALRSKLNRLDWHGGGDVLVDAVD